METSTLNDTITPSQSFSYFPQTMGFGIALSSCRGPSEGFRRAPAKIGKLLDVGRNMKPGASVPSAWTALVKPAEMSPEEKMCLLPGSQGLVLFSVLSRTMGQYGPLSLSILEREKENERGTREAPATKQNKPNIPAAWSGLSVFPLQSSFLLTLHFSTQAWLRCGGGGCEGGAFPIPPTPC